MELFTCHSVGDQNDSHKKKVDQMIKENCCITQKSLVLKIHIYFY